MRLLRTLFGPSDAASTEKLLDLEVARLWDLVREVQQEKANLYRESLYWRDKFMTLMGMGDMSYPAMGGPSQMIPREEMPNPPDLEQEPSHVSLIGLRARHELEAKKKAREMERERKP